LGGVKIHFFPTTASLYQLKNLAFADYSGDLNFELWFERNDGTSIKIEIDKMYLSDYPNALPSLEDKRVGVDMVLKLGEASTVTVTITDALDPDDGFYDW